MFELHRYDNGDTMLFDGISYMPCDHYVLGYLHGGCDSVYHVKETRAEVQALLEAEWGPYQYPPDIMTRAFEAATQIIADEACTGVEKLRSELLVDAASPGGETDAES